MSVLFKSKKELELAREVFSSYFLDGGERVDGLEEKMWSRVKRYLWVLRFCPFLEMVAVGNTLAFGVVDEESDIDLFVVAKRGRLFFVRTVLTLYFQLMGVRRHGRKVAGRFCLSFFVASDGMDLSEVKLGERDYYLFFWVLSLKVVIGKQWYVRFLAQNGWVYEFVSKEMFERFSDDFSRHLVKTTFLTRFVKRTCELVCDLFFIWWLENLLRVWQMKRSFAKLAKMDCGGKDVVISKKMLKFHDQDARCEINAFFERKWKSFEG